MKSYNEFVNSEFVKLEEITKCKKCNGTGYQPQKTAEDIERYLETVRVNSGISLEEWNHYDNLPNDLDNYTRDKELGFENSMNLKGSFMLVAIQRIKSSARQQVRCSCYSQLDKAYQHGASLKGIPKRLEESFGIDIIERAKDIQVDELVFRNSKVVETLEELLAYSLMNGLKDIKMYSVSELIGELAKDYIRIDFDGVLIYGIDIYNVLSENQAVLIREFINNLKIRRIPIIIQSENKNHKVFDSIGLSRMIKVPQEIENV